MRQAPEAARATGVAPEDAPIAVEGVNCWRRVRAGRLAAVVDVECYYTAIAEAFARAERSILIAGWDIHSELRLRRDGGDPGAGPGLRDLLVSLVERRRRLHVHILIWDFAMVFALEREMFPVLKLGWQTPRRIHFHLDDHHPLGASQHQKVVVVDDAVAFSGGIDLTTARWDTRRHLAEEPRRIDVGKPTGPTHDVQVAVDGEAARVLGSMVRERWRRATGHRLRRRPARGDRWPASLPVDLRDVDVALARTLPAFDEEHEVREVERLYLDAIAAARRALYIENQYFTSTVVADALAARLAEPDGPDIVYIGPLCCSGWLEEITMGVLRARLLRRLAAADAHGRFRAYWVAATGDASVPVVVHSKVMVVDERLARIGSANLSNRSMGLDSECDVVVEACGDPAVAEAIARLRDDLLAEHLDVPRETVATALAGGERLTALVERLRAQGGRLMPLEPPPESVADGVMPDSAFIDLERPAATEELLRRVLADQPVKSRRRSLIGLCLVVVALTLLGVAWRVGPLSEWLEPSRVAAVARRFAESPWGPLLAAALFVPAGFVMAPVVVMLVAAGIVFGPWTGFVVGLLGSFASALTTYAAGRWLWRDTLRRIGGQRLNRVSRRLARRGVLAVIALRVVPVAPFTVVNLAAGASHIGFRDFALGTLLGMAPGTLALTVLAGQIRATWENPDPGTFAALLGAGVLVVAVLVALRRTLGGERAR